jgi:hypothetical protein
MRDETIDPVIAAVRRDLRPAPGAKAASWAALQARIEDGELPRLPPTPKWTSARAPFWIGVALAAAAAVLVVGWLRAQRVEAVDDGARSQAMDDAKTRTSAGEATTRADRASGTATTATTSTDAAAPAIAPPRERAPQEPRDDGESEVELVVRARQALVDGDAGTALRLARAAGRRFPAGSLGIERAAIEVRALCRLDRADEARTKAQALAREHEGNAVAAVLASDPCADE